MLFLSETALLFAAFVLAAWLDPDLESLTIFLIDDSGLLRIALAVAVILLGLYLRGYYAQLRIRSKVFVFVELVTIFSIALVVQGILGYVHKDWTIPRKVALAGTILGIAVAFLWRLLFDIAARGETDAKPILFLGLSPTVLQLAGFFQSNPEFGLRPIGYLASGDAEPLTSPGMSRLGSMSDFGAVLDSTRPSSVVIGRREDIQPAWTRDFLELRFAGVNAEQAATLYEKTFGRVCAAEIWPSKMIFGDTWKTRPIDIALQTLYSRIIAAIGLLLFGPFMVLAAILIAISSRGPVLSRERSVGIYGTGFVRYRFRCHDGARLTFIGRILDRTGIAALPQLFNVLAGHMAIAGPAPDRPEFADWLSERIPFYRQRQQVRPGMAGWASIHYDAPLAECDVMRRLEYDLYYVKRISPAMDTLILLLALKIKLIG